MCVLWREGGCYLSAPKIVHRYQDHLAHCRFGDELVLRVGRALVFELGFTYTHTHRSV